MHPIFAPITVQSRRRHARSVPVAGSLAVSLLASVWLPTSFIQKSQAAEAAPAAEKQAPLLVGLRHQAAIATVAQAPVKSAAAAKAQPAKADVAKAGPSVAAPLPAPGAPQPPARPDEYKNAQAAEAETPTVTANATDVPLPPTRPAELTTAQAVADAGVDAPLPPSRPDGLGIPVRVASLPPAKATVEVKPEAPRPAPVAIAPSAPVAVAPPAPVEPRRMVTRETTTVPAAPGTAEPSFFDRLFGRAETPQPEPQMGRRHGRRALAYAAQEPATGSSFFGGSNSVLQNASPSISHPDRYTAVYDISARTVYLPDGTRLEAHSGLREHLDDPRSVHMRMRGSTPPNVYELTPREALFHGVEALRLNPVAGHTYGRTGLLAHTYMLGPNGDSNGCVSFRDYHAFLNAYKRGEIRRLAVVAHR